MLLFGCCSSATTKRGLCAVLESAGREPSSLSTVWCSTSENMSLWTFWGWCQKCARTVFPWFRPRWRRLTCRHLPEASAVRQQVTRGRPVPGHRLSRARLSLLCTGTVHVHPSMCPADVAEEEAAAVHDLRCHLRERQQDIKMPLHPRVSLMGLPPPTGCTRLFILQQYIWQNEGKRPLNCLKPRPLGSDWMAAQWIQRC